MLLHIDSFDSYSSANDLTQTYYITNGTYVGSTGGRFGKGCVQLNNSGQTFRWSNNTALTEIWVGFAYAPWASTATGALVSFLSAQGAEASVYGNLNTGTWFLTRGLDTNAVLGSSAIAMTINAYHWIEIHYSISNTVGVFELWVDNTRYINLSNINSTSSGSLSFSTVSFGAPVIYSTNVAYGVIDDIYILDTTGTTNNTRLGDSRIETLVPTGDAGPNNGTPSTGTTHYNLINKIPWSGSTPITISEVAGQEELYNMSSLSVTPTKINAVKVKAIALQTSGGSMYANTIVVSNGVENDGNASLLSTSFGSATNIFATDPNTSNTWTSSSVNTMSCGFKVFE